MTYIYGFSRHQLDSYLPRRVKPRLSIAYLRGHPSQRFILGGGLFPTLNKPSAKVLGSLAASLFNHSCRLCPLAKQRHDGNAEKEADKHENDIVPTPRTVHVEQKVTRQQLYQPRVQKNSGRDGVEDA